MTLLGDIEAHEISGKDLGTILSHACIKPEATRVALHRLKKDGWIQSTKTGREVSYSLSDHGRADTRAAYQDVYRQDIKYPDGWRLVLLNTDEVPESGLPIARSLWLMPTEKLTALFDPVVLDFDRAQLPDWFLPKVTSLENQSHFQRFSNILRQANQSNLDQKNAAVIRLLCLHHWRKAALRHASWAELWLNPTGHLASCHKEILAILSNLRSFSS